MGICGTKVDLQMSDDEKTNLKNEGDSEEASPIQPLFVSVTRNDFAAIIDLESPLTDHSLMDCHDINGYYLQALEEAKKKNHDAEARVFSALMTACLIPFHEKNPHEPFVMDRARGVWTPKNFRGEPELAFHENAHRFKNPALQARVADIAWVLDKKRSESAYVALNAYVKAAKILMSRDKKDEWHAPYLGAKYLGRALAISSLIKDKSHAAKKALQQAQESISGQHHPGLFMRLGNHDVNFDVSDVGVVAQRAKEIIANEDDAYIQRLLWDLAARDYGRDRNNFKEEKHQCHVAMSDCSVRQSDKIDSAMRKTHFLEQAIADLHMTHGTKERQKELKKLLTEAQENIRDEMSQFSTKINISDIVESTVEKVRGKSLLECLGALIVICQPPDPQSLRASAEKNIANHPLSNIFSSVRYDEHGRPIARSPGMSIGENDENNEIVIRRNICEEEAFRRGMSVSAGIMPIIRIIATEHQVEDEDIEFLCFHSPFIPDGKVKIYVEGFIRFLRGDMIAATHILFPQMENSVRHYLKRCGVDISKLKRRDMTQEVVTLSAMLDNHRQEMEDCFTPHLVMDIDNVFNYREGPNLRNRLSHGLMHEADIMMGHEVIYACWLIFHICFLPLLKNWDQLASTSETMHGQKSCEKQLNDEDE